MRPHSFSPSSAETAAWANRPALRSGCECSRARGPEQQAISEQWSSRNGLRQLAGELPLQALQATETRGRRREPLLPSTRAPVAAREAELRKREATLGCSASLSCLAKPRLMASRPPMRRTPACHCQSPCSCNRSLCPCHHSLCTLKAGAVESTCCLPCWGTWLPCVPCRGNCRTWHRSPCPLLAGRLFLHLYFHL